MANLLTSGDDMERMRRRKSEATAKGGQAFLRLLSLAEAGDSGQAHTVARFIASSYNGQDFPYDLYDLRLMDVAIGDDMLLCIDALRWGQSDLHSLVPDGDRRRILGEKGGDRPVGPEMVRAEMTAGRIGD